MGLVESALDEDLLGMQPKGERRNQVRAAILVALEALQVVLGELKAQGYIQRNIGCS